MAQDELGHAQVLAALHANEFVGDDKRAARITLDDPLTHPATVVEYDRRRWLVAPYGQVSWVRNARADGRGTRLGTSGPW